MSKITSVSAVGVCADPIPRFLKQQMLLFDRIAIPDLNRTIQWCDFIARLDASEGNIGRDLEFLRDFKIVFDAGEGAIRSKEDAEFVLDDPDAVQMFVEGARAAEYFNKQPHFSELERLVTSAATVRTERVQKLLREMIDYHNYTFQMTSQTARRLLLKRDGTDATLICSASFPAPKSLPSRKLPLVTTEAVRMTLARLPVPDDRTPLQKILDFRSDHEARGYLIGLRTWLSDVARQQLSVREAEEKLDWLLFQQEQHLKAHRIVSTRKTLTAIVIAGAEILEDLVKIKWGKAAQGIVSIVDSRTELLKSELSGPAKEVNYIIRARNEFEN